MEPYYRLRKKLKQKKKSFNFDDLWYLNVSCGRHYLCVKVQSTDELPLVLLVPVIFFLALATISAAQ